MNLPAQLLLTTATSIAFVFLKIAIALVKILFWSAIAFAGWVLFRNGEAWYWSVVGIILMVNGLGVILPILELLPLVVGVILLPFLILKETIKIHKESSEARKDAKELWSIAVDCIPRKAYNKFHVNKSGYTIHDLYNMYFAILVLIWTRHLEETGKESDTFREIIEQKFKEAFAFYRSLAENAQRSFTQDYLYLSSMTPEKNFPLWITAAVHCATDRLTTTKEDKAGLGELFINQIIEFNKANDIL